LLFPTCGDAGAKAYLADGTFIVRTTAGEALAISIPRTEAWVDHLRSEILVKSPSEMRAAAKLEVGSHAAPRVDEGDGGEFGAKGPA
jgi:hypothetical protein